MPATGSFGHIARLFHRFHGFRLKSTWGRILLPFLAILGCLVLQFLLAAVIPKERDFPYALFYLTAIMAVAWYGGYVSGVIASVLTLVGLPAMAPGFTVSQIDPSRVILMAGVSILVSRVAQVQSRSRELLRQANDQLDQRVQARTQELDDVVVALRDEISHHRATEKKLKTQLERLSLLDQITRAIGERQDLKSVFQVAIRSIEDDLPVDFGCICLYDAAAQRLTVTCVGIRSETLAMDLALTEEAHVAIDQNGLSRCVQGRLVYEPDISQVKFPFPQRLYQGGLNCFVAAPLLVESQVFGILVAARHQPNAFSSTDCEFLRQLSEHVALAANQAQVHSALQQAYNDLRQTQQAILQQERLRALGQMASGIAHDINNALSPVALYTEILLDKEPDLSARTREYLETTRRAIEDVAHTVARMKEFYRKQDSPLALSSVELNTLVSHVLNLTRARWSDIPQKRGIVVNVRTELAAGLPAIGGIEGEIREALTNLVFNAVDAMPEGGTLTLRTGVDGERQSRAVFVEVSDSGVGMDEETRRRCLEPFFTTKGERGSGLGLAMVYGMIQRHGADIAIHSEQGVGTTMHLSFPEFAGTEGPAAIPSGKATRSRLRILVIDDDPLLIKSLRDTLESEGHTVTVAHGGKDGIAAFEGNRRAFDVVITDLGMPHVDGRKVASAVKAASGSTPVILLTGWGQRLVAEGEMPPFVDRILNKPPKLRELRAALEEYPATGTDRPETESSLNVGTA